MGSTALERFNRFVNRTETCWEWLGHRTNKGYGLFWHMGTKVQAHRFAYEAFIGPIADGLFLDHLCRNRGCVNPYHLEPVTNQENCMRGDNAQRAKTHCPKGHLYAGANLSLDKHGWRRCAQCHNENNRIYKANRRNS